MYDLCGQKLDCSSQPAVPPAERAVAIGFGGSRDRFPLLLLTGRRVGAT